MGVVEDARHSGVDLRPWGKVDRATRMVYALLFHLIDVGAVAGVLWDRFLTRSQREVISAGLSMSQERARSLVAFLAAMHDIGKLIPYFQSLEPAARMRLGEDLLANTGRVVEVPHARASMHAGLHLLGELGFELGGNDSPAVRAQVPHSVIAVVGRPPPAAWFPVGVLVLSAAFGPLPTGVGHEVERSELVYAEDDFGLVFLGYDLPVGDRVEVLDPSFLGRVVRITGGFQVFRR